MTARFTALLYASMNQSTPNMLKLGKTVNTAQARANQTVTGSPYPMVPMAWTEFQVADYSELHALETAMHNHPLIAPHWQNHGGGREWFAVTLETFTAVTLELQYNHAPTREWLSQQSVRDQELAARLAAQAQREAEQRAERERIEAEQRAKHGEKERAIFAGIEKKYAETLARATNNTTTARHNDANKIFHSTDKGVYYGYHFYMAENAWLAVARLANEAGYAESAAIWKSEWTGPVGQYGRARAMHDAAESAQRKWIRIEANAKREAEKMSEEACAAFKKHTPIAKRAYYSFLRSVLA